MRNQLITISVIGGHKVNIKVERLAENIGKIIAKVDAILVCGGLDGVMRAVCKGARSKGGLTIGLLPGIDKLDANPYVDIPLPTSFGYARNAMVACSADIIIALPGSHGTSSEISYGIVYKRPVIDMGNWNRDEMIQVNNLKELELKIRELIKQINKEKRQKNRPTKKEYAGITRGRNN